MGRAIQQALPRCGDAVGLAATPLRRFLPLRAPLGLTLRALLGGLLCLGALRRLLLLLACGSLPPRCFLRLVHHRRRARHRWRRRRVHRLHHAGTSPAALRAVVGLGHGAMPGGRRQVSLTTTLTCAYVGAAMTPRSVVIWITFALPGRGFAQNVSEVQVAPPTVTVKVGERSGLLATAFDRAGNVIPTVRFIWSSNNVSVAKVDNDGTVTGVAGGVAIVEARVGPRRGQAAVQVIGAPSAGTQAGAPPQTTARPTDGTGGVHPLAGQPPGTGPASVMRIEPPTVYLLPSENTRVVPRALKDDGSPAAPVAVPWKSLRPDIASVDQNGAIVALSAGQGTVQVTSSTGLTATAPVVVQPSDIAIQEPSPVALGPNDVDTLHVIVPGQGNRVVSPLTMQWASADPNVARVSLTGVVTAVAPGKTTLSVSGLLQTKSVDIVVHKTVAQLTVIPVFKTEVPLPIQGTAKFQVTAVAPDGTPVPEAPIRWSVGDTSLASFDPATGSLTGKKAGKTTLTARGPGLGLAATWQIRVIAAALKLSATRLGLPLNRRYGLRASFADETGTVIGPAPAVTFASDNPPAVAVAEDGTISATGYGHP